VLTTVDDTVTTEALVVPGVGGTPVDGDGTCVVAVVVSEGMESD
jgi:hypothetical protein